MNSEVAKDLGDSSHDFARVVWPELAKHLGGGTIEKVEGANNPTATRLDVTGGIDWMQMLPGGIRTIASRVQWIREGRPSYRTFTIRTSRASGNLTEYAKRCSAIDGEAVFPHLTVQAFLTLPKRGGRLLSVASIPTRELIDFTRTAPNVRWRLDHPIVNRDGRSSFIVIHWHELQFREGLRVHPEVGDIESPECVAAREQRRRESAKPPNAGHRQLKLGADWMKAATY